MSSSSDCWSSIWLSLMSWDRRRRFPPGAGNGKGHNLVGEDGADFQLTAERFDVIGERTQEDVRVALEMRYI